MHWLDEARERLQEIRSATAQAVHVTEGLAVEGVHQVREHGAEWARDGAQQVREHGVEWVEKGAEKAYDFVIGDDLRTLMDPKASTASRALAAVSIASNFVGPEGKLGVKAGEIAVKALMEHGGEKLLAAGLKELERTAGKEAFESAEKFVVKNFPKVAELLEKTGVRFEETVKAVTTAQGAYNAAINLPDHVKRTINEAAAAFNDPNSTPAERLKLLGEAAKDGYASVADVLAMKKALDAVHPHVERPQAPTPAEQRRLFAADETARPLRAGGATLIETDHAIIDCRAGKTLAPASLARLVELKAEHPDKAIVVLGKNLNDDAKRELGKAGITVATTDMQLKIVNLAAKIPGGDRLVRGLESAQAVAADLKARAIVRADEATLGLAKPGYEAYHGHKESAEAAESVRTVLEKMSPETIKRLRESGPAQVGLPHLDAQPWNGRAAQTGSVTSVIGDRVEQYVGGGRWTTYTTKSDLKGLEAVLADNKLRHDPHLPIKIEPGDRLDVGANGTIRLTPADREHAAVEVDPHGHHTLTPQQAPALQGGRA